MYWEVKLAVITAVVRNIILWIKTVESGTLLPTMATLVEIAFSQVVGVVPHFINLNLSFNVTLEQSAPFTEQVRSDIRIVEDGVKHLHISGYGRHHPALVIVVQHYRKMRRVVIGLMVDLIPRRRWESRRRGHGRRHRTSGPGCGYIQNGVVILNMVRLYSKWCKNGVGDADDGR